jgi:methionyl-tRNA formyltransferase
MLMQKAIPIGANETAGELHDRLAMLGAQMVIEVLRSRPAPVKQEASEASYATKISKDEAVIDWNNDAITVDRKIRAFNPFPGASTMLGQERIKIWRAQIADAEGGTPGMMRASPAGQLIVACGSGAVSILELQRAGGKRLATMQFLAGFPITAGVCFGP